MQLTANEVKAKKVELDWPGEFRSYWHERAWHRVVNLSIAIDKFKAWPDSAGEQPDKAKFEVHGEYVQAMAEWVKQERRAAVKKTKLAEYDKCLNGPPKGDDDRFTHTELWGRIGFKPFLKYLEDGFAASDAKEGAQ